MCMPRITSITNQAFTGISISRGTPEASYDALVLDSASYNEGDTITATLTTSGIDDAVTVAYTVTGISANDITSGSLSGTFTIDANRDTATWTLSQDGLTEGTDTFVITLASTDSQSVLTGELTANATVIDTSNDPASTPFLDDNDDIVLVDTIIGQFSMQLSGVFALNPATPFIIEGRTSGATTVVTNITANTGTVIEIDDNGNSIAFTVGEELNLVT